MIKKFKAINGYRKDIEIVHVERESDNSVWIKGNRRGKVTDYETYFDDFDSAKSHLLSKAEEELNIARRRLETAQGVYGNVKGLKNPDTNSPA